MTGEAVGVLVEVKFADIVGDALGVALGAKVGAPDAFVADVGG